MPGYAFLKFRYQRLSLAARFQVGWGNAKMSQVEDKDHLNDDVCKMQMLVDLLLEANDLVKDLDSKLLHQIIKLALLEVVQNLQTDQ